MNLSITKKIKLPLALLAILIGSVLPAQAAEVKKEVLALSLDKALQIALEKNKDILKAREYRNQVEGKYVEERAAALPQFAIRGSFERGRDESQKALARNYPVDAQYESLGIGLSQVLYSFGQVEAGIRAAKIGLKTADDQLILYQQAAIKDVSLAFYDALLSRELYALARQNLEQRMRLLDEARKKYAAGTATDYDVLSAEVTVENARPEVIRTENLIPDTLDRLRFLLALRGQEIDVRGSLLTPLSAPPSYEDCLITAWKNRPELSAIKNRIGIGEELVNIYKAMNKPRLDLKASYGWKSLDLMNPPVFGQADGPAWLAGVYLTFPFFDGLRTQGKVAQARSDVATLRIEEAKLLDGIVVQIRQAFNAVMESEEIVKGLSGTVSQAQRLLGMAEKGYEFGVKTKLDVDDANLNLIRSQLSLARAQRDYLAAQTNLQWAMGIIQAPTIPSPPAPSK
jgi:outer membrane protein TolC